MYWCNVVHLCTRVIWAVYTKKSAVNFAYHIKICAKFQANWMIYVTVIDSQINKNTSTKKFFESNVAPHWHFGNPFLSGYHLLMSKLIFDSNVLLFFCMPLYMLSFGNVHPFSKQIIVLRILGTYANFIKFYVQ